MKVIYGGQVSYPNLCLIGLSISCNISMSLNISHASIKQYISYNIILFGSWLEDKLFMYKINILFNL